MPQVQQGDTVSGLAQANGMTISQFLQLNPQFASSGPNSYQGATNLIYPGQNYSTNPTVQSSTAATNAATNAQNQLQTITNPPPSGENQNSNQNGTQTQTGSVGALVGNQQSDPLQGQVDALNSSAEAEINNINNIFAGFQSTMDQNTQNLINSITQNYANRIAEQNRANQALIGSTNVSGIVSGRSRYAQEVQAGILSAEETAGIQRIASLESEKATLISQAQQAADEKKMNLLFKKMEEVNNIRKQQQDAIADLHRQAIDFEKLALDKAKEARQVIKDDIANMEDLADNIAGALSDRLTGDKKLDEKVYEEYANEYGVTPDYLKTAVGKYKNSMTPAAMKEFEYMKKNYGFKGSPLDYMRNKRDATRIATTGGTTLTLDEAEQLGLPKSVVGMNEKELIQSLSLSKPPAWFKKIYERTNISEKVDPGSLAQEWNRLRNSADVQVFRNSIKSSTKNSGFNTGSLPQPITD